MCARRRRATPAGHVAPAAPSAFAATPDGTVSAAQTLTLTNSGNLELDVALTFAGSDPGDFMIGSSSCLGRSRPARAAS